MEKIAKFLIEKFELSEGEANLYLKLLELQTATVLNLSQLTGINRITAHGYINNLIDKGLISQSMTGSRRILIAESPERLASIFEQRKLAIKEAEQQLPDIIQSIYESIPKAKESSDVDVKFYEGRKGVEKVYRDVLKATKIYSFVNVNQIKSIFPENIELFQHALSQNKDMEMWEIIEDRSDAKEAIANLHKRYYCKFTPKDVTFTNIDLMIFDQQVALVGVDKKIYAIVISSPTVVNMLKAIHKVMWRLL